jgi:signal peptidase II
MVVIVAGAIGNFIDRVTKGYVIDYFYFKLIDFPVFNVADCYITVAVIVFLIICFFVLKENELDYLMSSKKKWQVENEAE